MNVKLNVEREQAALAQMTVRELRQRYAKVFGDATRTGNKVWLTRRILWRLQADAEGDLTERARQRAAELAHDADLRLSAPRVRTSDRTATPVAVTAPVTAPSDHRLPMVGTVLTRTYKGRPLRVLVREDGFEWQGERYPSLSAVAKAITGTHTNGFLFFKLNGQGARP